MLAKRANRSVVIRHKVYSHGLESYTLVLRKALLTMLAFWSSHSAVISHARGAASVAGCFSLFFSRADMPYPVNHIHVGLMA